jgi:hypothetical protein
LTKLFSNLDIIKKKGIANVIQPHGKLKRLGGERA